MAEEMGSERDALVNEAMQVYARLHGFVVPRTTAADAGEPSRERRAAAERVLEAAERLERDIAARPPQVPGPPPVPAPSAGLRPGGLRVLREDGSTFDVVTERFVIGRGGHCDLVIDSPKVSREHAVFERAADGWWIVDLGSSNGTWCLGEKIDRRKIEHGDEYFLSAEKLRCALR